MANNTQRAVLLTYALRTATAEVNGDRCGDQLLYLVSGEKGFLEPYYVCTHEIPVVARHVPEAVLPACFREIHGS